MTRISKTFLALICACALPQGALADIRALLIGVGDYSVLDADLKGPGFDVGLMADTLVARGVAPAQITALTTMPDAPGLPNGALLGLPTRAEIITAMERIGAEAARGDTVIFYFSGHGSQMPDASGDEQGGADEILLPMDAAGWKGAIAAVENALLDDELHDWAAGLTARGIKLIGVIDACHSGTGFRAAPAAGAARVLAPDILGIPDTLPEPVVSATVGNGLVGEFAFLYSSQPDQRSFEYPLGDDGRWHGAFTLALSQTLREVPQASWGQVVAATRDRMTQGAARQEPDAEGPLLDSPVFGEGAPTARFVVTGGKMQAGLLQGLTEGTTVAIYADPAGGEAQSVAVLTNLSAATAELSPPQTTGWAEITRPAAPRPLALGAVVRLPTLGKDVAQVETALQIAGTEGIVTADAGMPDLVPVLTEGTLALVGPDGVLDPMGPGSSPRAVPRAGETMTEAAVRLLENAAHTTRVRAVLAGLGGRGLGIGGPPVAMQIERRAGIADRSGCGKVSAGVDYDPARGVAACDELWLTLTNASGRVQDVTVFYQSQDFTLTPIWPVNNLSNRLALGESVQVGLRIEAPDGIQNAAEEIIVLALSPEVTERRADLTALATPERLRDLDAGSDSTAAFLSDVASLLDNDPAQTRGFGLKRPALTMLRQAVRLRPQVPE